jgi:prepilin-type N-terminal cleavage/methylation domain-containing protein
MRHQRGFSLIELVFVIVVLFGSIVAFLSVSGEAGERVADNNDKAKAVQLAQEKIEQIIADRRNPDRDYSYIATANYSSETLSSPFSGFTRTTTITDASSNAACPSATLGCKLVVVNVVKSSVTLASVTLMIGNYR